MKFNDLDLDKIYLYNKFIFNIIFNNERRLKFNQKNIFKGLVGNKEKIKKDCISYIEEYDEEITQNILKLMENINDGFL